ncbi:DUF5615 family PIN-like protein [Aeoliella mucimassa]|uniref:DUF5615 domain-containing protein n=1 Tax=Aeoliella mucimassa TaxID=2527972 RepID=A0A518AT39_9BACT|nr:DUF5615 family PIN-like protein [Aeoliella mucimassa]QDU57890.1 hypothetical protein Pan181_41130 [Aeoliella mucimassa]
MPPTLRKIQYYLDEHVALAVAAGLRERGIDVLNVQQAGMLAASDIEHLEFARSQGRVVFSQDADFLRLHAMQVDHAGIVYAPQQTAIGSIIGGLTLIAEVLTPEEMQNHVEFL